MIVASEDIKKYFEDFDNEIKKAYESANKARSKGIDPELFVDIPLAQNMVDRAVGLISIVAPQVKNQGIEKRIEDLEKQFGRIDWRVALTISLEIAQEKFCKFKDKREAMEVGIRFGLAYITLGVVVSPLEGFVRLELKKRRDGKEYFALYYSGPIRSAGGTGASVSVVVADYIRLKMGYDVYDATKEEIKRSVTEVKDYHERITNLQYLPSDEEIVFLASKIPVQITGDPSEKFEVSNYKDLDRIGTNLIRNGFCLVFAECFAQKAKKVFAQLQKWGKDFFSDEWNFLDEFLKIQQKSKAQEKSENSNVLIKPDYTYIKDLVAGRPVFTHPLAKGGFRLRYGRGRNTGLSAQAIHPSTMYVLNNFIAIGTQLKVERPGKACVVGSCDSIDGPIVKLKNGDVLFLEDPEQARKVAKDIEEILHLGDILINYGDFLNRAHKLVPPGYCDEWWCLETGIKEKKISIEEAKKLSLEKNLPLHPRYLFRWSEINKEQFNLLLEWLRKGAFKDDKLVIPYHQKPELKDENLPKRILELIGVLHKYVLNEYVVIEGEWKEALMLNLGGDFNFISDKENVLDILNEKCKYKIRDKSGTSIGARMGRPEKAKMRKLTGSPQILFAVGNEGGKTRSFNNALAKGKINADFPNFLCEKCNKETVYSLCEVCGNKCIQKFFCTTCKKINDNEECCGRKTLKSRKREIDINYYLKNALKILDTNSYPELIKGVRGTSSKDHIVEHLSKGILRAKYGLYVNKDGTIRYDMIEMPLTHFKPKEIGLNLERLKKLSYKKDVYGNEIINDEQIIELKSQDIVIPCSPDTLDEKCDDVMLKISRFIDELLEKLYKTEKYYNLKTKEDLIGQLVISLSPHTSSGIVSRIIGFSKTQGFLAHPYLHSLMRRDCVFPTTKFVYSDKNKKIYYDEIGPFVEDLIKRGAKTKVVDTVGTLKVECNQELVAYGSDPVTKEIKEKKIKHFIKGPLTEEWIKITTATNRNYTMTQNHDFMFLDESNNFKFKKANEIKIDDKLLVLDYFKPEINFSTELNLIKEFIENLPEKILSKVKIDNCSDFFKNLVNRLGRKFICEKLNFKGEYKKNLSRWYQSVPLNNFKKLLELNLVSIEDIPDKALIRCFFGKFKFNNKIKIDENLANLLGYYTAEGHLHTNATTKRVSFRNSTKLIQEAIFNSTRKCFGVKPILEENNTKITICYDIIYYLLKYCFKTGSNAHTKRVPRFLYNSLDEIVSAYISAYIDGDGSIVTQRDVIDISSVNKSLLDDISFLLTRFNLIGRFCSSKLRLPGRTVLEIYKRLGKKPKYSVNHHLIYSGIDCRTLSCFLNLNHPKKAEKLKYMLNLKTKGRKLSYNHKQIPLISFGDAFIDYVKSIEIINEKANSYCLEVDWKEKEERNIIWGNQIINTRCDGDEACIMLLMDVLLNFSKKYLPKTKGATQDEPLLLSSKLLPTEVDDMVFDMDVAFNYPLEFYEAAMQYKNPWEIKISKVKDFLDTEKQYGGFGFTHDTSDINRGVVCSAYKFIPSMGEKVKGQLDLAKKIRAVNEQDVARLVIEKHFIRDIKGNLRKFSTQQFRCVECNAKFRRPPLSGICLECGGKLLLTVSEGFVIKYLNMALDIAEKYDLPVYLKQNLKITKKRIESLFGKEKDKQKALIGWFN